METERVRPEPQRWTLDDKYLREEGTVYLTGTQALVRLTLDQHRADRRRGLRTATLVSGYRGSPLGGLDIAVFPGVHLAPPVRLDGLADGPGASAG